MRAPALRVRLLSATWLWCWEICMARDGELIESSWATTWTAYSTCEEARAAGEQRLAELRAGGDPHRSDHAYAA